MSGLPHAQGQRLLWSAWLSMLAGFSFLMAAALLYPLYIVRDIQYGF
ncbi:MAG: hypothetical protein HFF22_07995 [Oscillospiraceae bacterium]|nr:hypothetical protein [Oscillospiraceae bacterium]